MKAPGEAVHAVSIQVVPRKNESPEKMIRRFTKRVRDDGILKEVVHRTYFEKPSVVRRRKRNEAKWNSRKNFRK